MSGQMTDSPVIFFATDTERNYLYCLYWIPPK